MSVLRALQRVLFQIEDFATWGRYALCPLPADRPFPAKSLELMELEKRILLSGVPPGGDALVQDVLDQGAQAASDVQVAPTENRIAYSQQIRIEPRDRLIAKVALAHSSTDIDNRLVGWGLTETGWGPFIQDNILPAIEAGFTRIELHNPFGRGADDQFMAFDQFLDAVQETPKLAEGFADFWRPITDSGIEVIAYIGSPGHNPVQISLENDPTAWWDRALAAVQPIVDAGMSIGLDASANAAPDSMDTQLAEYLRSQGVRVYIEARPAATSTQWFDYPLILKVGTWNMQAPELHSNQVGRHAWEHDLTGEVVRIIRTPFGDDVDILRDVLAEGHTATLNWRSDWQQKAGDTTVDEVLENAGVPSLPTRINLRGPNAASDPLTYTIVSGPAHGSVTAHPQNDALVTYVPDPYYSGTDAFTFQVTDAQGRTETATISLTIRGFTPPPAPPRTAAAAHAPSGESAADVRKLVDRQVGLRSGQVSLIPRELTHEGIGLSGRLPSDAEAGRRLAPHEVDVGEYPQTDFGTGRLAPSPAVGPSAAESDRMAPWASAQGVGAHEMGVHDAAAPTFHRRTPLPEYARDLRRWSSADGWQADLAVAEVGAGERMADVEPGDADQEAPGLLLEEWSPAHAASTMEHVASGAKETDLRTNTAADGQNVSVLPGRAATAPADDELSLLAWLKELLDSFGSTPIESWLRSGE